MIVEHLEIFLLKNLEPEFGFIHTTGTHVQRNLAL